LPVKSDPEDELPFWLIFADIFLNFTVLVITTT